MTSAVLRCMPAEDLYEIVGKCNNFEDKCKFKLAYLSSVLRDYPLNHNQIPKIQAQKESIEKKKGKCTRCLFMNNS